MPTSQFEDSIMQVTRHDVAPQLSALISELRGMVLNLETEIETLEQMTAQISELGRAVEIEENRAYVFHVQIAAYPILAQNLRVRRDNLLATIAMLETAKGIHEDAEDQAA